MPLFFLLLVSAYLAGNVYIFIRALQIPYAAPVWCKIAFSILFWILALSFFVAMLTRNVQMSSLISKVMFKIGSIWLVFTLYMVIFLFLTDMLKLMVHSFNYGFLISLAVTASLLIYGFINYQHPKTNIADISIDKEAGPPLKIVAISDIHLGYGTGKKQLKRYVEMINRQNPDLILIAGDMIDNTIIPLYAEKMMEELSQLNAPLGIYMVPGNHEYISGIGESLRFIKETPIRLLRDSIVTLDGGIQLVGRDDRANPSRMALKDLIAKTDKTKPIILMDHQPYNLDEAEALGIDIQFSGHTHNGQLWPFNLIIGSLYQQSHGYRKWGNTHVFVSSGLSLWGPPFRIGTNSEMVVMRIIKK